MYRFLFTAVALTGLFGFQLKAQAQDGRVDYTTRPLEIKIDDKEWASLSPEAQAVANVLLESLSSGISRITDIKVELPGTVFDGSQIVSPQDLLIIPDFGQEVRELGGRDLTNEQIREISQTATYRIASPTNPNLVHV